MAAETGLSSLKKIAEGREAEMFALDESRVLRLYRNPEYAAEAARTIEVLRALKAGGVRVPEVFGRQDVGDRPGVILERLDGRDLLTVVGAQPWKVWSVGRTSGRVHSALNGVKAPELLETTHSRMRRQLAQSHVVPDEFRVPALKRLDDLEEGDWLSHGDFHPANLMVHRGTPVVIDWSNATRGTPEADFLRSRIILGYGEPPPGAGWIIRMAATFARRILLDAYNGGYRRGRKVDEQLMRAWELPVAVARLAENIPAETDRLTRLIRRLLRDA